MSTITKKNVRFKNGTNYRVAVETYESADEVIRDLHSRPAKYADYDMQSEKKDIYMSFHGVNGYGEALDLLRVGYQPTVEKLQVALKASKTASSKRVQFENNVHGFAPVVPLALKGVPNSMVNTTIKPMKFKVINVYYDMGVNCNIDSDKIVEAGQKLLGAIIDLEKQGYRFNLYALQAFSGDHDADVLCVKVKSSDKGLDIKRMSFPLTHPAFFRVIGFDWQSRSTVTSYRGTGRGRALTSNISDDKAKEFATQTFGENAVYISCNSIIYNGKEEYIKEVLTK